MTATVFGSVSDKFNAPLKIDGPVHVGKFALLGTAEEVADQLGNGQSCGGAKLLQQPFIFFWNGGMDVPIAGLFHPGPLRPHLLGLVCVLSGAAGAALAFGQLSSPPGCFLSV